MKLERLNENQIRCTLTKSDLDERHLRLSELAYGSTKARELFQDMIQQAASELGFETENIPLMIEAIPISSDCLILVVTKVENPEELDNRFSRFSNFSRDLPFGQDNINDEDYLDMDDYSALADEAEESPDYSESDFDPLGLIAPLTQAISEARKEAAKKNKKQEAQSGPGRRVFAFPDLDQIISLAAFLDPFYEGTSTLYKDPEQACYYLLLDQEDSPEDTYRRACLIASEYGLKTTVSYASPSYFLEHFQLMFEKDALKILNQLNG